MKHTEQSWNNRLINLRKKLKLTQRELAKEFGVSPGAVALWEMKDRNISGPVKRLLELYETNSITLLIAEK